MAARRKKATRRRVVKKSAPVAKFKIPKRELELILVVGFALLFLYYVAL